MAAKLCVSCSGRGSMDRTDADHELIDAALYKANLSHIKATDIFIGLKYWARASRYEPTPKEQEILEQGTARSNRSATMWCRA